MQTFELTRQRSGAITVRNYQEDGEHRGAVAVMEGDPRHGAVIRVSKFITLAGLDAVLARLRAEHQDLIDRWEADAVEAALAREKAERDRWDADAVEAELAREKAEREASEKAEDAEAGA